MSEPIWQRIRWRLLRLMGKDPADVFPYVMTLDRLTESPCRFHITSVAERMRVSSYGGEEDFLRSIVDELSANDILYDIGACLGLLTVPAATVAQRVVSFEPDPRFRETLAANLRLNKLRNVDVLDWAVSDEPGTATLHTDGLGGSSPSLRGTIQKGTVEVRIDRIDDALERGEIPVPNVVKMDIEGAEGCALRGMQALLGSPQAPRALFLELHPKFLTDFGSSVDEVEAIFDGAGYALSSCVVRDDQEHRAYRK